MIFTGYIPLLIECQNVEICQKIMSNIPILKFADVVPVDLER